MRMIKNRVRYELKGHYEIRHLMIKNGRKCWLQVMQLPYSDLMRGVALNRDKMEGLPAAFAVIRKEDGNTLIFFDRAPTRGGQMQLHAVRFEDVLL